MKQFLVLVRLLDDPRRAVNAIALIEIERTLNRSFLAECARENGPVLDRHRRALRQIRQRGMSRIAEDRDALRAPIADRRPIVHRPAVTLVLVGRIDDRLDRGMPTSIIGFEVFPRELERPGFLGDWGLDSAGEIQELAAAEIIAHDVAARSHENR